MIHKKTNKKDDKKKHSCFRLTHYNTVPDFITNFGRKVLEPTVCAGVL